MRHLQHVSVAVWDTAGQEHYQSMVPLYSRGADIVLAVFDASEVGGMEECVGRWGGLPEMSRDRQCKVILVGTKYDMVMEAKQRQSTVEHLDEEQVKRFAEECGFDGGMVVSSKSVYQIGPLLGLIADLAGDALINNRRAHAPVVVVDSKPAGFLDDVSCCKN